MSGGISTIGMMECGRSQRTMGKIKQINSKLIIDLFR
jgi:hypothetical protein